MARNLFESDKQQISKRKPRNLFQNNSLPEEESFVDKLPRNIGIGLANLGHSTLNAPHDLTQGFENATQALGKMNPDISFPQGMQQLLAKNRPSQQFKPSEYIPYQQEYDFANMLGQKGEPTFADSLIQKGVEYSPELLMGGNALRNILPHLTRRGASKSLNRAHNLGIDREIGSLNIPNDLIEDTRQFLPNTSPYRNLIDEAKASTNQKIPFEKYDIGNPGNSMFGVSHNSGNTVLPTNYVRLKGEGNKARVISSNVEPGMRGKGIGKALYKEAIDDAIKKGLQFESDSIVSNDALNVYKSLEKEGYKFKFNPKIKENLVEHNGNHYKGVSSLDEESPVVEFISKPKSNRNNYKTLFDLQSDLGKHAGGLSKDLFSSANRAHGRAGLEVRENILNEMKNSLRQQGHGDIADLLTKGQDEYRRYMNFKPYRNAIGIAGASLAIPKNPLTSLLKKLWTHSNQ